MRPFPARYYPFAVTFRPRIDAGSDDSGGESAAFAAPGTTLRGDVQLVSPTRNEARLTREGGITAETHWLVLTATDFGARADDLVEWLGRKLIAVGPPQPTATDPAGNPVSYTTETIERT